MENWSKAIENDVLQISEILEEAHKGILHIKYKQRKSKIKLLTWNIRENEELCIKYKYVWSTKFLLGGTKITAERGES